MKKGLLNRIAAPLIAASLVLFLAPKISGAEEIPIIPGNMIRLHVVANSDSRADQSEKLLVRDAVVRTLETAMEGADDASQARALIGENLDAIQEAARETLAQNGHGDRSVCVTLATEKFPSIAYHGTIVPAGAYLALRVVIGDGAGHNWWCVLFPPMCFAELHYDEGEKPGDSDEVEIRSYLVEWADKLTRE